MHISICPAVTAPPREFKEQLKKVVKLSVRIHIDVADGKFAPSNITSLDQITLPKNKKVDIHVMYQRPLTQVRKILKLQPSLVIIHAESDGIFVPFAHILHKFNIAVGIALLPDTKVHEITPVLKYVDHALIFSGNLGFHGGVADLDLLDKVKQLKALKQNLEIGWDGGINDKNAKKISAAGVNVLNVGGYLANAKNPMEAYAKLKVLTDTHS